MDDEFRDKLLEYDWTNFGNNDINNCWNIMYFHIDIVLITLCPMKVLNLQRRDPNGYQTT